MDWKEITGKLSQPLDPKHVRKPSGSFGPKGDYIEGWHAIDEANRIFGFGNWSYAIKELTQVHLENVKGDGKQQWQAAYTCILRVVVGDTTREDVGFGSGFAKNVGDAVEGATKEAVTDALKRCLRTYGNPFGLALYDKNKANVRAPELSDDEKVATLVDIINSKGDALQLTNWWGSERTQGALKRMSGEAAARVQVAYDERVSRFEANGHTGGAFDA